MYLYFIITIIIILYIIINDCNKRWKNIRDTYKKQKKRLPTESVASEKKWPLMENLLFLDIVEYQRKYVLTR